MTTRPRRRHTGPMLAICVLVGAALGFTARVLVVPTAVPFVQGAILFLLALLVLIIAERSGRD